MSNPIEQMLVLSTGHLSKETADALEAKVALDAALAADATEYDGDMPPDWAEAVIYWPKGEYGWFVYLTEDTSELPTELEACMHLARATGCPWIMFDRDATLVDGLPTYEW